MGLRGREKMREIRERAKETSVPFLLLFFSPPPPLICACHVGYWQSQVQWKHRCISCAFPCMRLMLMSAQFARTSRWHKEKHIPFFLCLRLYLCYSTMPAICNYGNWERGEYNMHMIHDSSSQCLTWVHGETYLPRLQSYHWISQSVSVSLCK